MKTHGDKYTVHYIHNNHVEVRSADSLGEAKQFISRLENLQYFDIHGGWNVSKIEGLIMWAGTEGYWAEKYKSATNRSKELLEKCHSSLEITNI